LCPRCSDTRFAGSLLVRSAGRWLLRTIIPPLLGCAISTTHPEQRQPRRPGRHGDELGWEVGSTYPVHC